MEGASSISCIILAGGKSERMGKYKALASVGNKAMILHVLQRIEKIFSDIVIVVKDDEQKAAVEKLVGKSIKIVLDNNPVFSPIVGIKEGIKHIRNDCFFLTACDMPFLNENVIMELLGALKNKECAVVKNAGAYEPFCAVYRKNVFEGCSVEESLRSVIEKSDKAVLRLAKNDTLCFFNVNSKEDLEKARKLIKKKT